MKTGILLVNLGTPKSPKTADVKNYLTEFLMDERVIDLPFIRRLLLVKGLIVPFRASKVAREYQKLWLDEGSPLLVYGKSLRKKLSALFVFDQTIVELAMRYQNPSIEAGLRKLRKEQVDQIIIFPLFPQYASATTGSVAQKVMSIVKGWNVIPNISFINSYHDSEHFIQAFANKVRNDMDTFHPDHILFSYHGIPERHLTNIQKEQNNHCSWPECSCEMKPKNKPYCYRSACFQTSELIARKLQLPFTRYSTSFQSRLGKSPWIQPYTDEMIRHLAKRGIKNLLVVSPSFVADCLETTLEIGEEYHDLFLESGGESLHYTRSLNDDITWAKAIQQIIYEHGFGESSDENPHIKAFRSSSKTIQLGLN